MTIDTSRFEIRVSQYDVTNFKLGVWDKQRNKFVSDFVFDISLARDLLLKTIKEHTPKLVYKKLVETIRWQQISQWDHVKEKFFIASDLNQSYPYKKLEDIPTASGAIIEIEQLVKRQYRCEFEK